MTPAAKTLLVKQLARAAGFSAVGVTHVGPVERAEYYRHWLAAGHAGTMHYLARNVPLRAAPAQLLAGARSIVCVALSYKREPRPPADNDRPNGRVAGYAQGRDYHAVLREMLEKTVEALRPRLGEDFGYRVCVDTAPVLERELAARAGLGWIGKNTCVLDQQLGSFLLLGELVTTLELAPDGPVTDHCGRCTRCIDACPTGAILAPRELNASLCISYLTIEHRGEVPPELQARIGDWVFGCDICQDVCPYNRKTPAGTHPELTEARLPAHVDLLELLALRSGAYRRLTRGSAATRASRPMWRRNAAIALGNAKPRSADQTHAIEAALRAAETDEDEAVRHAAVTAIKRARQADPL